MGETDRLVSFKEETSPSKFIALIGVLFMIFEATVFFYNSDISALFILFGILEIVFAAVIFLSLELINLWKIRIPYFWWLLLIFGTLLIIFDFIAANQGYILIVLLGYDFTYFPAILILFAFIIELLHTKKEWKASKILTLLGSAFAIYDCVLLFVAFGKFGGGDLFTFGFFGLIAVIVLLLTMQEWFDIRIPFTWWGLLAVGFIVFNWVSPIANQFGYSESLVVAGFGGILLLLSFVLHLKDY